MRKTTSVRTAPAIRQKTFTRLFSRTAGNARLAIVGEALGYRGGHFSGIPMTSERMLLGNSRIVAALLSAEIFGACR